ncbi:type II toxin-antitoxin system VapC family toxin [Methylophilus aquaticus]|uniref:Type II toxin-antitoxin system VapC family toxin n=1 Tax=Methylophilus aquaticus TaxID=1971610 RepID=A0ABT9JX16_9PROT|nr:type II toxin-antitoxin system VapC family toxin [Methylophilus aquaticus]MDP8568955.1 type II toxin-antitoxin system VapC family toxin [Methylophilus aquaticus]
MRLLLDTHILLWAAAGSDQLSSNAKSLIENPENQLYFSSASLWEIAIKNKLGRADFKVDLAVLRRSLLDNGFEEIMINSKHAISVETLPDLHKDPFDRMLLSQTLVEGVTLVTADSLVAQYPVALINV